MYIFEAGGYEMECTSIVEKRIVLMNRLDYEFESESNTKPWIAGRVHIYKPFIQGKSLDV
jgi:hypothetical protein